MSILEGKKVIHFIGCGGSGMFPIIQILHGKGYTITGSDVNEGDIINYERNMGIKVTLPHAAEAVEGADLVVYSRLSSRTTASWQEQRNWAFLVLKEALCWAKFAVCSQKASA